RQRRRQAGEGSRERNIIVMTGITAHVSDRVNTFALSDGHEYHESVTGTGCSLESVIAACVSVNRESVRCRLYWQRFMATLLRARLAAGMDGFNGPGSWAVKFVGCIYGLRDLISRN